MRHDRHRDPRPLATATIGDPPARFDPMGENPKLCEVCESYEYSCECKS